MLNELRLVRPKWLAMPHPSRPTLDVMISNEGRRPLSVIELSASPEASGWSLYLEAADGSEHTLIPLRSTPIDRETFVVRPGTRESVIISLADLPGWEKVPPGEFRLTVQYQTPEGAPEVDPPVWEGLMCAPAVRTRKP